MTPALRRVLRIVTSAACLALVAVVVEPGAVLARLARLEATWVVAAIAISVLQIVVSALRWRYTAARLGVDLPLYTAVGEYYLATFLNQVLPGGVVGDVSRAWRHHRAENGPESTSVEAVHAVILERSSGQVVVLAVAVVAAALLGGATIAAVAAIVLALAGGLLALARRRGSGRVDRFLADGRRALLGPALPVQVTLSVAIVASYVLVFVLGARAVGVETPVGLLALTAPPILVAMLIPVSVAGWGLREGAAAAIWGFVGLSVADGVAVSVAYGLLVLASSLPGAVILLVSPGGRRARDRRGDPTPG